MPETLTPSVNSWLEDELYQQYLYDRKTVDPTWNKVFESNGHTAPANGTARRRSAAREASASSPFRQPLAISWCRCADPRCASPRT